MITEYSKICLILSCKREYYAKRREASKERNKMLKSLGFTVIFLFGDENILHSELRSEDGDINLYVPIEDTYMNITYKMLEAYKYLSRHNVRGILKLDDDVIINEYRIFGTNFMEYDYAGLGIGRIYSGPLMMKYTGEYYNIENDIIYFAGPFYWLSNKAILQVVNVGYKYPWEDVNTGHAISLDNSITTCKTDFFDRGYVYWNADTEHN